MVHSVSIILKAQTSAINIHTIHVSWINSNIALYESHSTQIYFQNRA